MSSQAASNDPSNGPSSQVAALWRRCDVVCFDVDSTVCAEEGIDVLSAKAGVGREVAEMTSNAMNGSLSVYDALVRRLSLIQPTPRMIAELLEEHPAQLSPGIEELVRALQQRGTQVFLVSGGFREMIEPVAERLGLDPKRNVIANVIRYEPRKKVTATTDGGRSVAVEEGNQGNAVEELVFAGVDESQPTCRNGGKLHAVQMIRQLLGASRCNISKGRSGDSCASGHPTAGAAAAADDLVIAMVGDGVTDMEARVVGLGEEQGADVRGADLLIGFGGVVRRPKVVAAADWFVDSFDVLREALQ